MSTCSIHTVYTRYPYTSSLVTHYLVLFIHKSLERNRQMTSKTVEIMLFMLLAIVFIIEVIEFGASHNPVCKHEMVVVICVLVSGCGQLPILFVHEMAYFYTFLRIKITVILNYFRYGMENVFFKT